MFQRGLSREFIYIFHYFHLGDLAGNLLHCRCCGYTVAYERMNLFRNKNQK